MTQFGESYLLRCQCGTVECLGRGKPIGTAVCYCDDCQAAGHELQALAGAPPILDRDGGTTLTLFRVSRFEVTSGDDQLVPHRLKPESGTKRMVASCCNSAMFLAFDKGPHWVSTMRRRFIGQQPQIDYRHMTKFRTSELPYPDNVATYPRFPVRFLATVLRDWVAMKLGR